MAEQLCDTPYGKFIVLNQDIVGREIARGIFWEAATILPVYQQYLKPDFVCVEIGANIGQGTVYMAQRCKKVIAIEAQPYLYELLCKNIILNGLINVECHNLAAYDKTCKMRIGREAETRVPLTYKADGEVGYGTSYYLSSVAVVPDDNGYIQAERLENVIHERIDFVQCDAQGCDIQALLGMEKLLAEYHPVIMFEFEYISETYFHVPLTTGYNFLTSLGYNVFRLPNSPRDYIAVYDKSRKEGI